MHLTIQNIRAQRGGKTKFYILIFIEVSRTKRQEERYGLPEYSDRRVERRHSNICKPLGISDIFYFLKYDKEFGVLHCRFSKYHESI